VVVNLRLTLLASTIPWLGHVNSVLASARRWSSRCSVSGSVADLATQVLPPIAGWLTGRRYAGALLGGVLAWSAIAADGAQGLVRAVSTGAAQDLSVVDNVGIYVPAGEPATPFVLPGPFKARWTGSISAELRAEFSFHAEFSGELKLTVNTNVALEAKGAGNALVSGTPVKLKKGANSFQLEYTAPATGDAYLRLYWSNKETPLNPVPVAQFSHADSPELAQSLKLRRGRDLFTEFRCAKCHSASGSMPELTMDAPAFAGIGSGRQYDWLARWIENPKALRATAHMPKVFGEADGKAKAEAVAAYLASLKAADLAAAPKGDVDAGKALFEKLHCVACHGAPDGAAEVGKISQKQVKAKFAPGALVAFLQNPTEHYAWIRMPNFKLSAEEAGQLAAYLESVADAPVDRVAPTDAAVVAEGKKLVSSAGCLSCHVSGEANQFTAKSLADLASDRWTAGCLADTRAEGSKAPDFGFSAEDREALRAFGASDRSSLGRQTPADFLERHSEHLNCRECHGKFEGFPVWELLAGKLKPEWASKFVSGKEPWKPRTWLDARMPGFAAYGETLGRGLATVAGLPPTSLPDPAPADTADQAKIGQKLASPNGGFACVSCHSIADFAATQVFEAPGLNLAHTYERLQRSYFQRWLRAPTSVDPSTKMPVYFDEEGKSPLAEVLGGDGPKTIAAVWEYIRMADKMPKPE